LGELFPAIADAPNPVDYAAPAQVSRGERWYRPLAHLQKDDTLLRAYNMVKAFAA
jgi:acyl-CoA synthetase (NDP forming)